MSKNACCQECNLKFLTETDCKADMEKFPYTYTRIYRCRICNQVWKIRWQWDRGTGQDNIWLKPGESRRGYTFTQEEATIF